MNIDKRIFNSLNDEDMVMAVNVFKVDGDYLLNFEFTLPINVSLIERIKKAWSVIRNKSHPVQEILLTKNQGVELKEFLDF